MSNIRSTLVGALLVIGAATVASAQHAGQAGKGQRGFRNPDAALLKGITLSDAEKSNIKNVHVKYAQQTKALHEQFKPQLAAARDARQRGDTAAMRASRATIATERKQEMALRRSEQNDLRSSLSADNQARFDTNAAAVKQRFAKRGATRE